MYVLEAPQILVGSVIFGRNLDEVTLVSDGYGNCVGEEEISNTWQIHYQSLLTVWNQHSIKQASVKRETTNILNTSNITFTPIDI